MAVTNEQRAMALRFERERRRLELVGVREAAKIGRRMTRDVLDLFESGSRIFAPTIAKHLADLEEVVLEGSLAVHLAGMRRAEIMATQFFREKGPTPFGPYEGAIDILQNRLDLTDLQLTTIASKYGVNAAAVTSKIGTSLERSLQLSVARSLEQQENVRAGTARLSRVMRGVTGEDVSPHIAETLFRTQTNMAYSAGRYEANLDPAIDSILWGYIYIAIDDSRVREEHIALDGTELPKNHPLWDEIFPLNGFNCRCTVIEVFERGNIQHPPPPFELDGRIITPGADEGFKFHPGKVFAGTVARVPALGK